MQTFTKEHKDKLSKARLGKVPWNKGKLWSSDVIEKMRLAKLGKVLTEEHKKKVGDALRGEKNYQWKGPDVSYRNLHRWVEKYLGKPVNCTNCKKTGLKGHEIHWANKSGKYHRLLTDWIRLCAKCHKEYDKKISV